MYGLTPACVASSSLEVRLTDSETATVDDLWAGLAFWVTLVCAFNFILADKLRSATPQAFAKLLSLQDMKQNFPEWVVKKTLDPVWHNEIFSFYGVLGRLVIEPLKMTFWDFDLASKDDLLGHVDIDLGDHTYCNELRRDLVAALAEDDAQRVVRGGTPRL